MIKFLEDLLEYCIKYNINFTELTKTQQNYHIRKCLKHICQCGRYKL